MWVWLNDSKATINIKEATMLRIEPYETTYSPNYRIVAYIKSEAYVVRDKFANEESARVFLSNLFLGKTVSNVKEI